LNATSGIRLALMILSALRDVMNEIVPLIALLNASDSEVPDETLRAMREDANGRTNAALQRLRDMIDQKTRNG